MVSHSIVNYSIIVNLNQSNNAIVTNL